MVVLARVRPTCRADVTRHDRLLRGFESYLNGVVTGRIVIDDDGDLLVLQRGHVSDGDGVAGAPFKERFDGGGPPRTGRSGRRQQHDDPRLDGRFTGGEPVPRNRRRNQHDEPPQHRPFVVRSLYRYGNQSTSSPAITSGNRTTSTTMTAEIPKTMTDECARVPHALGGRRS